MSYTGGIGREFSTASGGATSPPLRVAISQVQSTGAMPHSGFAGQCTQSPATGRPRRNTRKALIIKDGRGDKILRLGTKT